MTIVTAAAPARARNVLVSEWIKFRSVRSTDLTLVLAAVAAVPGQPVEATVHSWRGRIWRRSWSTRCTSGSRASTPSG